MDFYRSDSIMSEELLRESVTAHLTAVLRVLVTSEPADLEQARHTGEQRALQGAPLPEVLRAFRIGFGALCSLLSERAASEGIASGQDRAREHPGRGGQSGQLRSVRAGKSGLPSSPEEADQLLSAVLGPLLDLPTEGRELLLTRLRIWLDNQGNTKASAERMYCHPNTLRHRLRRGSGSARPDSHRPVGPGRPGDRVARPGHPPRDRLR